jgi:anti-sigma regulatory factor (Ser/Thr protein kinase)
MEIEKNFLEAILHLDNDIKNYLNKLDFNFPIIVCIDKSKNMEEEINRLFKHLNNILPKTFESSIPYILSELTDNIEQHSHFSEAYILIKYDSIERSLKICIYDNGLSIPKVFRNNKINFSNDSEAIRMALEGKTTKKEDISRGFGLRTTRSIVNALNGGMHIVSGNGIVILIDSKINLTQIKEGKFNGTLIYLILKTPEKSLNIYEYLE